MYHHIPSAGDRRIFAAAQIITHENPAFKGKRINPLLASALAACGVRAEVHIYQRGPHGISLGTEETKNPREGTHMIVPGIQSWTQLVEKTGRVW